MEYESVCKVCGEQLRFDMPSDVDAEMRHLLLQKVVPLLTHDECYDERWAGLRRLKSDEMLIKRGDEWGGICPPLYQDTVLDMIPSPAKQKALAWQWGQKGLMLHGATGSGKTRTAYLILKREHMAGRMIVTMTHTEFSREAVRLAVADSPGASARWTKIMARCDILFIDDFGKSRFSDLKGNARHADELMFDILDRRITTKLPTILTTNDVGESLIRRLPESHAEPLVRRLREFCTTVAM
jgi:hypothetical protein